MNILVPNLGSTSLKYRILEMPSEAELAAGKLERVRDYREAIGAIQAGSIPIHAVAFKAVHAGPRYRGTFLIDDGVMGALEEFLPAAPAHNAIYLTGIRAFRESLPGMPLVAAFETEFHRGMPDFAREYGVPAAWREAGVARYGFHGASHQYIAGRAAAMLGRPLRLVSCHLGGSSSMCAIDRGRSRSIRRCGVFRRNRDWRARPVRHGDLDVFAVLFRRWSGTDGAGASVRRQLAGEGGLAGLSGVAGGDVRDLESAGTDAARLALSVFAYQVKKQIGGVRGGDGWIGRDCVYWGALAKTPRAAASELLLRSRISGGEARSGAK